MERWKGGERKEGKEPERSKERGGGRAAVFAYIGLSRTVRTRQRASAAIDDHPIRARHEHNTHTTMGLCCCCWSEGRGAGLSGSIRERERKTRTVAPPIGE